MLRTLQNIAIYIDAAQLKAATDDSINLNIIPEMIMKTEGDRLALVDIKNRIDVDRCPHLQTFAVEETELGSQVAEQPEERTRPADRQDRQQPETRKYPLHNAFRELGDGSLETIERLLAQGADVEEKDESGLTILQYVVENHSKQSLAEQSYQSQWTASIVEYLLDHGANVHFKDRFGSIALHLAALKPSKYTVDVMEILVKHGSNVYATDEEGRTPLYYVADQNTEWTQL